MRKTARFLVEKGLALSLSKGFTLVELLIVIALIGVLAVAVLAAINPLEQLNRARDTGMESDASQLLAAIDRYYASQEKFPWVSTTPPAYGTWTSNNDAAYGFISAQNGGIGICGSDPCAAAAPGTLLAQYELKSEFMNRKFIKATTDAERLWIGKESGGSKSVYACWIPTSQAKRTQSVSGIAAGSTARDVRACTSSTDWTSLTTACVICIPR